MTDDEKFENIMKQLRDLFGKKDEPKPLKLEVGKVYEDAEGMAVLIVQYNAQTKVFRGVVSGSGSWLYEKDGTFNGSSKGSSKSLAKELPGLDITNWWKE